MWAWDLTFCGHRAREAPVRGGRDTREAMGEGGEAPPCDTVMVGACPNPTTHGQAAVRAAGARIQENSRQGSGPCAFSKGERQAMPAQTHLAPSGRALKGRGLFSGKGLWLLTTAHPDPTMASRPRPRCCRKPSAEIQPAFPFVSSDARPTD